MLSEMGLAGTLDHEHFMGSWFMASEIMKLLSVACKGYHKGRLERIFNLSFLG